MGMNNPPPNLPLSHRLLSCAAAIALWPVVAIGVGVVLGALGTVVFLVV